MRNRKGGMNALAAYIIGPAVALFVLLALFSLLPYEWMTTQWPLGIAAEEVATYQRWFDHRPGEAEVTELETLAFEGGSVGTARAEHTLHLGAQQARATAWRTGDRWQVEVVGDTGLLGMHAFTLVPLNPGLVRLMYLQRIAAEHLPQAPRMRLVQVEDGGDDAGVHLLVERLNAQRLAQAGIDPDHLFAVVKDAPLGGTSAQQQDRARAFAALRSGERMALDTVAAALHAWFTAAGFSNYLDTARFALDPYSGRLLPVLGFVADGGAEAGWSAVAYPLAERWRAAMAAEREAWLARLAAIDAQWAPALANGGSTAFLEAALQQQRTNFLDALLTPGHPPSAPAPLSVPPLDPWLKPYLGADDTLRFTRGKHRIDRTVVCPPGMGVVLEKGARFTIAPSASWVINGPLHIRGTRLNPVFIRPDDPATGYGSVAVNGSGATKCRVQGLRMSGGTGTTSDGRLHPAMLSFHDCDLVMEHCELGEVRGMGAVDVRGGTVRMVDVQVQGGSERAVGAGRVSGELRQVVLSNVSGGTAVEVEAGQLALLDATVVGAFGTGVAASEHARVLVRGGRFEGCATGVAATDGAFVHVEDLRAEGVGVPWRATGDDGLRGGGRIEHRRIAGSAAQLPEVRTGLGAVRSVEGMDSLMVRLFGSVR